MEWRYIDHSDTDLLRQAHEWEKAFPMFYKESHRFWAATMDEALEFYSRCILCGLFEGKEFVGLIYMDKFESSLNVHLDLKRGHQIESALIEKVRDDQFRKGIKTAQVWVMRKNTALRRILEAAGFDDSGLSVRQGHSHGRVLHWHQLVAVRGF